VWMANIHIERKTPREKKKRYVDGKNKTDLPNLNKKQASRTTRVNPSREKKEK